MLRKIWAFARRDWQAQRSYRLSSILQIAVYVVPLIGMYFLSVLFRSTEMEGLDRFGGEYVPFLLVGVLVSSFAGVAMGSFTNALRGAQVRGTLETLLLTRTSLLVMFFGWTLYPLIRSTLTVMVMFVGGLFVIGADFSQANPVAAILVLVLIVAVLACIGLWAGTFALVFKQADPLTRGLFILTGLVSGAVYPVEILPNWLQTVARVLPHTHAIEAMRLAILRGYSVADLSTSLGVLLLYVVILLPFGIWIFGKGMQRAKLDGSLSQY